MPVSLYDGFYVFVLHYATPLIFGDIDVRLHERFAFLNLCRGDF